MPPNLSGKLTAHASVTGSTWVTSEDSVSGGGNLPRMPAHRGSGRSTRLKNPSGASRLRRDDAIRASRWSGVSGSRSPKTHVNRPLAQADAMQERLHRLMQCTPRNSKSDDLDSSIRRMTATAKRAPPLTSSWPYSRPSRHVRHIERIGLASLRTWRCASPLDAMQARREKLLDAIAINGEGRISGTGLSGDHRPRCRDRFGSHPPHRDANHRGRTARHWLERMFLLP